MNSFQLDAIRTIDDVIIELENIINWSVENNSRIGYFASLYQTVTCRVKAGIKANEFEDNPRMEVLDVIFAKRYIEAFHLYQQDKNHKDLSLCWKTAFDAAKNDNTIVMQQILLGINAHINLDLGISSAQTIGDSSNMTSLLRDFDKINNILETLVDDFKEKLSSVSPLIWLVNKVGKGKEDMLATFSIGIARTGAWYFGCTYHINTMQSERQACTNAQDQTATALANNLVNQKSKWLNNIVWLASKFESTPPREIIQKLRPKVNLDELQPSSVNPFKVANEELVTA